MLIKVLSVDKNYINWLINQSIEVSYHYLYFERIGHRRVGCGQVYKTKDTPQHVFQHMLIVEINVDIGQYQTDCSAV